MATTQKITTAGTVTAGGTTTSFSNTPQAADDVFTENNSTQLNDTTLQLDVMANDLGGAAKSLYSIDDGVSASTSTKVAAPVDLTQADTLTGGVSAWESIYDGTDVVAKIRIDNGKVDIDLAGYLQKNFGPGYTSLQDLGVDQTVDLHFTYAIKLGNGTLSWATANIHYTGTNDVVSVTHADATGAVVEDADTTPSLTDSLTATGTISFTDPDLHDTHTASVAAADTNTTSLGTLSLDPVSEAPDAAAGSVNWTYTLDNDAAQYLAAGESVTEHYTVTIDDGHGSTTTQDVAITITGTNDVPVAVADEGSLGENETKWFDVVANDTLDVDHTAANTISVGDDAVSVAGPVGVTLETPTVTVDNNQVKVDPGTAFDHLAAGEHATLTVHYILTGDVADTSSADLVIDVVGANDDPTDIGLSGDTIAEHATGTVGTLTTTDVDTSDTHTYTIIGGTGYGLFDIDGSDVVVNSGIELSPEANTDYTLDIQTDDGNGGQYHKLFTVHVTNDTSDDVVTVALPPTYNGPDSGVGSDPNNFDSLAPGNSTNGTITGNSNGSETIFGHTGNDTINGNSGNDLIYGGSGQDTINGNNDNDTIYGGSGNDTLIGANDDDTIYGGSGADTITGGGGNDQIYGGFGADSINADTGNDTIHYLSTNDTNDVITNFTHGSDKIDLSAIDADGSTPSNDTFLFGGQVSGAVVQAHSVTWSTDGVNTEVYADTDGNLSTAEFHITLSGVTSLSTSDFNTL